MPINEPHPESFYHKCGKPNVCWHADNTLWNQIKPEGGIVCIDCFIEEAEKVLGEQIWRLTIV